MLKCNSCVQFRVLKASKLAFRALDASSLALAQANRNKGTVQNKKYHNLWKKSKRERGGRGQGQNKKVYISNVDLL